MLDKKLQDEMRYFDEPEHDIMEEEHDKLVLPELEEGYSSFSNEGLKDEVYKVTKRIFNVTGKEPKVVTQIMNICIN